MNLNSITTINNENSNNILFSYKPANAISYQDANIYYKNNGTISNLLFQIDGRPISQRTDNNGSWKTKLDLSRDGICIGECTNPVYDYNLSLIGNQSLTPNLALINETHLDIGDFSLYESRISFIGKNYSSSFSNEYAKIIGKIDKNSIDI